MTKPARANESARLRQLDTRIEVDTGGGKGYCIQFVLGKVDSKHVGQVQHRSAIRVWCVGPWLGDVVCC